MPKAYLYGIISSKIGILDGFQGIGDPPLTVQTLPIGNISLLLSYLTPRFTTVSFQDAIKHVKVLEQALQYSAVIPFRFGTITESVAEIKNLLRAKTIIVENELRRLNGLFEVGIKAYWKKDQVLTHLAERYNDHQDLVSKAPVDRQSAIALGQRVECLLEEWREQMNGIHGQLTVIATDSLIGELKSMEMVYNGSFLVTLEQETKLKHLLQDISNQYAGLFEFHYTTQLPPYNFVKLDLRWGKQ